MDEHRRKAWEEGIAKKDRGEKVRDEEFLALLRPGMFEGDDKVAIYEEANLFLRYGLSVKLEPITWLGEEIAHFWFKLRDRDRERGENQAEIDLRDYIYKKDFDHWQALNLICARLHRERQPFPDILAAWAALVHEQKIKKSPKEKGNRGLPPYTNENRNRIYAFADSLLKDFGMAKAEDRIGVIADWRGVDETVVSRG